MSIDSVFSPDKPDFTDRPALFRERHGWCPYSERVWLALEHLGVPYDTIRIDNTGGPRPSYYAGQTPQVRWPEGNTQSESMDLVQEINDRYSQDDGLQTSSSVVQETIRAFRNIFPRNARPSSRAAFLFRYNGDPLFRSTFQETLQQTNDLLGETEGPFFCGPDLTAADVAWVPFLERYRYQLPCLHDGLDPYSSDDYANLRRWYDAMDRVPAYACRVRGDGSSWRKVLTMTGFGNAGVPPDIVGNMEELMRAETESSLKLVNQDVWDEYASTRPYVASTPQAQAAMVLVQNREAIVKDTLKRTAGNGGVLPTTREGLEEAMRGLASCLLKDTSVSSSSVVALAKFLDERMCVPRDMGAMSAAFIKKVAATDI